MSELQLQRKPQHARVRDRRGLAADASGQVRRDGCSERLALGQDRVRVDDVEDLGKGGTGRVLERMEDPPVAVVDLIQKGCTPSARRRHRYQFCSLTLELVCPSATARTPASD